MWERIEVTVTRACLALASLALLAAFAIGATQVLSRFIFQIPTTWTESALRLALVWCIFAALPVAIRRGALLSVDFADRRTRGTVLQPYVRGLVGLCTAALLLVMVVAGWQISARLAFQTIPGLGISVAYAYGAIPGAAFLSLITLAAALHRPETPDVDIQQ